EVHVVHSGRIGGNKGPAAKAALIGYYQAQKRCIDIAWPDGKTTRGLLISPLKSPDLLTRVHEFVSIVEHYKSGATGSTYAEQTEEQDDDDEQYDDADADAEQDEADDADADEQYDD